MDRGWVSLHRKMLDSPVFQNSDLLKVWIWCLLKATHKDYKTLVGLQEVDLIRGQFVFGRKKAANELNLSEDKTYRLMKKLETLGNISIKSTTKYSLVSIENWDFYQLNLSEINNKPTTNKQQINTNNNNTKLLYISKENYPQDNQQFKSFHDWCRDKNKEDIISNTSIEGDAYYLKYLYEKIAFYEGKNESEYISAIMSLEEKKTRIGEEAIQLAFKI